MNKDAILALLRSSPGLSVRDITSRLCGVEARPQPINAACRDLEAAGLIVRVKEIGSSKRCYLSSETTVSQSAPARRPGPTSHRSLPAAIVDKLREAGELWARSPDRPRIDSKIQAQWDRVIDEWAEESAIPLIIRKSGPAKGTVVVHHGTGREIICADNSPAQWVFDRALQGRTLSVQELYSHLVRNELPVVFAASKSQIAEMKYKGVLASCGGGTAKAGWKLCHIEDVSTGSRSKPDDDSIENIVSHFKRLMKPSNAFLVPKEWWGFGEMRVVVQAVKACELADAPIPATAPPPHGATKR